MAVVAVTGVVFVVVVVVVQLQTVVNRTNTTNIADSCVLLQGAQSCHKELGMVDLLVFAVCVVCTNPCL